MEYNNQSQIDSILGEIEYIMDLLGRTFNESTRNALMERMRSIIRSMAELTVSLMPRESMQEDDEPPSQPVSLQSPEVSSQEPMRLAETKRVFTLEELTLYNGTNGFPAYVAVNGIVYDVTDDPIWYTLTHFGLGPGQDLSIEFNTCHSSRPFILDTMQPVGRLESGEETLI